MSDPGITTVAVRPARRAISTTSPTASAFAQMMSAPAPMSPSMRVSIGLYPRVVFPEPDDPKIIVWRQRSSTPKVTSSGASPSVSVVAGAWSSMYLGLEWGRALSLRSSSGGRSRNSRVTK